jgi:hypothetical protein
MCNIILQRYIDTICKLFKLLVLGIINIRYELVIVEGHNLMSSILFSQGAIFLLQ